MSTSANPGLSERNRRFLELLAEMMTDDLDRDAAFRTRHGQVSSLLESGLFSVALQPIVSLHDDRRIGVEALARFRPNTAPGVRVRHRRDVGLTLELEILAASKALRLAPVLDEREFLSINMSPRSIVVRVGWTRCRPGPLAPRPGDDRAPGHRRIRRAQVLPARTPGARRPTGHRRRRGRLRRCTTSSSCTLTSSRSTATWWPGRTATPPAQRDPRVRRAGGRHRRDGGGRGRRRGRRPRRTSGAGGERRSGYLRPAHPQSRGATDQDRWLSAQDSQVHLNFPRRPRPRHRMSSTH